MFDDWLKVKIAFAICCFKYYEGERSMKKKQFKNAISKYLSLILILSLVIAGMSFTPCAKQIVAQAASAKVGGHRVVPAPERVDLGQADQEEGKRLKRQAVGASIQKLGEYGKLLEGAEVDMYKLISGAVGKYAPYNTSYDAAINNANYAYTLQVSKSSYDTIYNYNSAEYSLHYQHASEAAIYDNVDKVQYAMCSVGNLYFTQNQGAYYITVAAVAERPWNFAAMNQKLVNARARLISSIPELKSTTSPVEKEALIHDAIIDNVTYYQGYRTADNYHPCFTAYGALVEGDAVCDGYAQAFAYVLQAVGIDAIVVTGGAGGSESEASQDGNGHAWNMVRFGSSPNTWYEVDATWDDDGDASDVINRHNYFNLTTDDMQKGAHWRVAPFSGQLITDQAAGTEYKFENLYPAHSDWFTYDVPTSLKTNINSAALLTGESVTATATLTPSDTRNKFVKWITSDPLVADVDNGVITGVGSGTATITAVAGSNMSARAEIKVTVKTAVTGLTLSSTDVDMKAGETIVITPDAIPAADDNDSCTWTSSNTAVATVDNGTVTAVSPGSAIITATSTINPAVSATCSICVSQEAGTALSIGSGKKAINFKVLNSDDIAVTFKGTGNKNSKTVKIPAYIVDENNVYYAVTEIAKNALKGRSSLKSVTIPKTVVVIRKNAFKGCSNLSKITIDAESLKTVESGAFSGISGKAKITIKTSSKSNYNKLVKKIKKAGAKRATFKWKKG